MALTPVQIVANNFKDLYEQLLPNLGTHEHRLTSEELLEIIDELPKQALENSIVYDPNGLETIVGIQINPDGTMQNLYEQVISGTTPDASFGYIDTGLDDLTNIQLCSFFVNSGTYSKNLLNSVSIASDGSKFLCELPGDSIYLNKPFTATIRYTKSGETGFNYKTSNRVVIVSNINPVLNVGDTTTIQVSANFTGGEFSVTSSNTALVTATSAENDYGYLVTLNVVGAATNQDRTVTITCTFGGVTKCAFVFIPAAS